MNTTKDAPPPSPLVRSIGAAVAGLVISLFVLGFTYLLRALDFGPLRELIVTEDHLYDAFHTPEIKLLNNAHRVVFIDIDDAASRNGACRPNVARSPARSRRLPLTIRRAGSSPSSRSCERGRLRRSSSSISIFAIVWPTTTARATLPPRRTGEEKRHPRPHSNFLHRRQIAALRRSERSNRARGIGDRLRRFDRSGETAAAGPGCQPLLWFIRCSRSALTD